MGIIDRIKDGLRNLIERFSREERERREFYRVKEEFERLKDDEKKKIDDAGVDTKFGDSAKTVIEEEELTSKDAIERVKQDEKKKVDDSGIDPGLGDKIKDIIDEESLLSDDAKIEAKDKEKEWVDDQERIKDKFGQIVKKLIEYYDLDSKEAIKKARDILKTEREQLKQTDEWDIVSEFY